MKIGRVCIFLFLFLFLSGIVSASVYSNPKFTEERVNSFSDFKEENCQEGQDFIIQVAPEGCSPTVVRTDLLEEEDVKVYCKLQAMKINPVLDVDAINSINFGGSKPEMVKSLGYVPNVDVNGETKNLNSKFFDDIGYLVLTLKQTPAEEDLKNCEESAYGGEVCWVEGNLTAKVKYDLAGGLGLQKSTLYLPLMSDFDFGNNLLQYSFFNGKGYLRAESIEADSATVAFYLNENEKKQTFHLTKENDKAIIYLPSLGCISKAEVKLEDIGVFDTRAKLYVNGQYIEVAKGESFLNGKCSVRDVERVGYLQKVTITCRGDERTELFDLVISPSAELEIAGKNIQAAIGQKVYSLSGERSIYLGYIGTDNDQNLEAYLVALPSNEEFLTGDKLDFVSDLLKNREGNIFEQIGNAVIEFGSWAISGQDIVKITEKTQDFDFSTKTIEKEIVKGISIRSLGVGKDVALTTNVQEYYDLAVKDYKEVIESYKGEKYPRGVNETLDEKAYLGWIDLAYSLNQKGTVEKLCSEFVSNYPDSKYTPSYCTNPLEIANSGSSVKGILIDGQLTVISLINIVNPSYEDYGVQLSIDGKEVVKLSAGEKKFLEGKEYIELDKINDKDSATFIYFNGKKEVSGKILKGNVESFKGDHQFSLISINLKNVAKVSVSPAFDTQGTEAKFSYKIGVEKRAIQLSPEKIKSLINSLDSNIKKWNDVSEGLGTVVKGMKTACLATGALLTVKNFVQGMSGEAIARNKVMNEGDNAWNKICAKEVEEGSYSSIDTCLLAKNDDIQESVNKYVEAMEKTDETIKGISPGEIINTNDLTKKYAKKSVDSVMNNLLEEDSNCKVIAEAEEILLDEGSAEKGIYSLEELKEIELNYNLYSKYGNNPEVAKVYCQNINESLKKIVGYSNQVKNFENNGGYPPISYSTNKDTNEIKYYGQKCSSIPECGGLEEGKFEGESAIKIQRDNTPLILILGMGEENIYFIDELYAFQGGKYVKNSSLLGEVKGELKITFVDSKNLNNQIDAGDFKVRYFEEGVDKGKPAIVPFDKDAGWYVKLKGSTSTVGVISSYDSAGNLRSFYLNNVGPDGKIDTSDDYSSMIYLDQKNVVGELSEAQVTALIKKARQAVSDAAESYAKTKGKGPATILGKKVEVGSPAVSLPGTKCTDFMSPKDCHLLFNLCDPVVCPSDRCDFGGAYPVQDVVQSGIVGSLALCLPNFKEGIYIPVCLTGVKAGIDGFLSVMQAYSDCLNENLETGRTVGMCDKIHSVYLCEFFWKQSLPLFKVAVPELIKTLVGEKRGGGTYSNVQSAMDTAQNSLSYFTQNYAVNAFKAFKARGQEEIGSEICNNFVSVAYPSGGNFLDSLTEADSPPQFTGSFEKNEYSSAMGHPTYHYKVSYHIYAGKDSGVYYKVYLKSQETSYYEDSGSVKIIDSGYVPVGEYADKTPDFTSPQVFGELCIRVNEQEKCGFKEVSTNFASNFVGDEYVKQQTTNQDIKTEADCVKGTTSAYSLLNLNVQSGVENTLSPDIYSQGIVRVCATDNPGQGSDANLGTEKQRWKEVGYCGDENLKCWLDSESVKEAVEFQKTADDTIKELEDNFIENQEFLENCISEEEFKKAVEDIEDKMVGGIASKMDFSIFELIEEINSLLPKCCMNYQKAYLYLLRGSIYSYVAKWSYEEENKEVAPGFLTIYDIIEREDYVSHVFEYKKSAANNFCYRYFDRAWHEGDCNDLEKVNYRIDSGYWHKSIERDFTFLSEADYVSGTNKLFELMALGPLARLFQDNLVKYGALAATAIISPGTAISVWINAIIAPKLVVHSPTTEINSYYVSIKKGVQSLDDIKFVEAQRRTFWLGIFDVSKDLVKFSWGSHSINGQFWEVDNKRLIDKENFDDLNIPSYSKKVATLIKDKSFEEGFLILLSDEGIVDELIRNENLKPELLGESETTYSSEQILNNEKSKLEGLENIQLLDLWDGKIWNSLTPDKEFYSFLGVDLDFPEWTLEELIENNFENKGYYYLAKKGTFFERYVNEKYYRGDEGAFCANFVTRFVDYSWGAGMSDLVGIVDNAWDFSKNMQLEGGEVIYDRHASSTSSWSYGSDFTDWASLEAGDILGIYFPDEDWIPVAEAVGKTYTHTGIYVGEFNGEHYFMHRLNENIYFESFENLLAGKTKLSKMVLRKNPIEEIIRPNPKRLKEYPRDRMEIYLKELNDVSENNFVWVSAEYSGNLIGQSARVIGEKFKVASESKAATTYLVRQFNDDQYNFPYYSSEGGRIMVVFPTIRELVFDYDTRIGSYKTILGKKYSDYKNLIDKLYKDGYLTEDQYNNIKGGIFNPQESTDFVLSCLLINKYTDKGISSWTKENALEALEHAIDIEDNKAKTELLESMKSLFGKEYDSVETDVKKNGIKKAIEYLGGVESADVDFNVGEFGSILKQSEKEFFSSLNLQISNYFEKNPGCPLSLGDFCRDFSKSFCSKEETLPSRNVCQEISEAECISKIKEGCAGPINYVSDSEISFADEDQTAEAINLFSGLSVVSFNFPTGKAVEELSTPLVQTVSFSEFNPSPVSPNKYFNNYISSPRFSLSKESSDFYSAYDSMSAFSNQQDMLAMVAKGLDELSLTVSEVKNLGIHESILLTGKLVSVLYVYDSQADTDALDSFSPERRLLEGKGVCRHYSFNSVAIFDTLKLLNKNLDGTKMYSIGGKTPDGSGHNWNQVISSTENGVIITYVDPTWFDACPMEYSEDLKLDVYDAVDQYHIPRRSYGLQESDLCLAFANFAKEEGDLQMVCKYSDESIDFIFSLYENEQNHFSSPLSSSQKSFLESLVNLAYSRGKMFDPPCTLKDSKAYSFWKLVKGYLE